MKKLLIIAILLISVNAFGATIFVDATPGEDCSGDYNISTRDCGGATDGDSYQTINDAVDSGLSADDVINIRAGTYTEVVSIPDVSGSAGSEIILQNYTGEAITIAAGTGQAFTSYSHIHHWIIGAQSDRSNFNITATHNGGNQANENKVIDFEGNGAACQYASPPDCADYSLYGVYSMTFQNITMDGLFFFTGYSNTIDNIEIDGEDSWINTMRSNFYNTYGNTISNNIIHNGLVRGIWLYISGSSAANNVVEKNTVYDMTAGGANVGCAIDLDGYGNTIGCPYTTIRYNKIYNCNEGGIQLENAFHTDVYGNWIYDCDSTASLGIWQLAYNEDSLENSDMYINIYSNVIDNVDIGIKSWAGHLVSITNNTIYGGDQWHIYLTGDSEASGDYCDEHTVENNIMQEWHSDYYGLRIDDDPISTTVKNNMYYHSGGSSTHTHEDDVTEYTLAEWQAAKSGEDYDEDNSTFADPQFTTPGSDFTLKPGSPARHGADPTQEATRLRPEASWPSSVTTMTDILSIGAYGVYRGTVTGLSIQTSME